jgi:hypothetical protein
VNVYNTELDISMNRSFAAVNDGPRIGGCTAAHRTPTILRQATDERTG